MSEEIVSSEDIQFYEYLGLLEQAYYDTHVGSKAGTIITETIKSYVNILKYKNNKLQQKVEQLEKENKILKENAEHNDKVVDKVNWENMLLKGKIKDLKERIILKQLRLVNEETYNILHSDLNELLEVLDREIKYEQ